MKVGFSVDINKNDADSGKHKFLIRLSKEMKKNGITIDNKKPDIFLFLTGQDICKKAKKNVLRLDGLIFNTRWDYKSKNKKILKAINKSDALVYQGEFCQEAYQKFLGIINKTKAIIPNGADPDDFLPRNPKDFFLANCKWRPHKRLKSIVKSYLHALDKGLKSDLVITGKADYKYKHPKIKYVGWQKHKELRKLLSESVASLHLSWIDWCPNSMIEAIVANVPLIYSKSGGHIDLGEESGIGIEDIQWNFKACDLYSPPTVGKKEIANAMLYLERNKNIVYRNKEELNIKNVCKQYLEYFDTILNSKG